MTNKITSAAAVLGKLGGSVKSEAKAASSRENGKRGGRPRTRPTLHDYRTGEIIRNATAAELKASREAALRDGGAGVIPVILSKSAIRKVNAFRPRYGESELFDEMVDCYVTD